VSHALPSSDDVQAKGCGDRESTFVRLTVDATVVGADVNADVEAADDADAD